MAVTKTSRSFVLTALNDTVTQPIKVNGIALVGTGMVAGDRLTATDNSNSVVVDHYVVGVNENAEFQFECRWLPGFKLTAVPANGTWTVIVRYD